MLYKLFAEGTGPRLIKIGTKNLISAEAAADWRRAREAATGEVADKTTTVPSPAGNGE